MKISPSSVGKTIGVQLRNQQAALTQMRKQSITPSREGVPVAMMRIKVCVLTSQIAWAMVCVEGLEKNSVIQGNISFSVQNNKNPEEHYAAMISEVWPQIMEVIQMVYSQYAEVELDIVSQRAASLVKEIEAKRQKSIRVKPDNDSLVFKFISLASHYGAIEVLDEALAAQNRKIQSKREQSEEKKSKRSVIIATDASVGNAGAATGFVTSLGDFGGRALTRAEIGNTHDPLTAELLAIHYALAKMRGHKGAIRVKSDSLIAVKLLTGQLQPTGNLARARVMDALDAIAYLIPKLSTKSLEFSWVRGHAGDPLNEIADEIAVMTRRHLQAGIPAAESKERIKSRVLENLEQLNLAA